MGSSGVLIVLFKHVPCTCGGVGAREEFIIRPLACISCLLYCLVFMVGMYFDSGVFSYFSRCHECLSIADCGTQLKE